MTSRYLLETGGTDDLLMEDGSFLLLEAPEILVELYEGATLRKSWEVIEPTSSAGTTALLLSTAEKASITDWTNLRVRITANAGAGRLRVTNVYLIAPGAATAAPSAAGVAVSTWTALSPTLDISRTPNAAVSAWVALGPTLAISRTPSAAISTWTALSPTLAISRTPAAAVSNWVSVAPAAVLALTLTPSPAVSTWTALPASFSPQLVVGLYQGATLKALRTINPTGGISTSSFALTSGEIASITDWTDLRLRAIGNAPSGRIRITNAYLVAPGVAVGDRRTATVSISTWVTLAPSVAAGGISLTPAPAISTWVARDASGEGTTPIVGTPSAAVSTWVAVSPTFIAPVTVQPGPAVSNWVVLSPTFITTGGTVLDPWFPGPGGQAEVVWRLHRPGERKTGKRKKHRHPMRVPRALRVVEVIEFPPPLQLPPLQEPLPPPEPQPFIGIRPEDVRPPLEPMAGEAAPMVAEMEEQPAHWSEYAHLPYTAEDENEELQAILAAVLRR